MFNLDNFLEKMSKVNASDIHLMLGKHPALRVGGKIEILDLPILNEQDIDSALKSMLHRDVYTRISEITDLDFTYELRGVSRYRVNYCKDLGMPKLTMRVIPYKIPSFEELMLPPSIKTFAEHNNGIVLVTGATGSGKSTTIASMIEHVNKTQSKHIITIEDPIEFLYSDKRCLISQRGVGIDVCNFIDGLKYAMRQDPDIIVIGEIRDKETVEAAIAAAETGHFVLSTVHTNSATQTLNRIIGLFDSEQKDFIRTRLSASLRGTIAQKLIRKKDGKLVPALELMTVTPAISDYIAKDKMGEIEQLISRSNSGTAISMNASIYNLFKLEYIDKETALEASDNSTELYQMMRGMYRGLGGSQDNEENLI